MSPSNSSRRLTHHGLISPVRRRRGNAVAVLQHRAHALRVEQAERAFEHRAELVAGLQHVDGVGLHQRLQPFGQRRLAAADRAQQVQDLLALLEALRGMAEEADDALDRLFHAVEFGERRIDPDGPVHEDAAESRHPWTYRPSPARRSPPAGARWRRVDQRILAAGFQIFRQRHLGFAVRLEGARVGGKNIIDAAALAAPLVRVVLRPVTVTCTSQCKMGATAPDCGGVVGMFLLDEVIWP